MNVGVMVYRACMIRKEEGGFVLYVKESFERDTNWKRIWNTGDCGAFASRREAKRTYKRIYAPKDAKLQRVKTPTPYILKDYVLKTV